MEKTKSSPKKQKNHGKDQAVPQQREQTTENTKIRSKDKRESAEDQFQSI